MGFEDTLMNFLLAGSNEGDLVATVAEYRFQYAKLLVDNLKPDVILSHDDWGAKHSLFMDRISGENSSKNTTAESTVICVNMM